MKCICVVLSQTKNGLPSLFCRLMKIRGSGDELVVAGIHALHVERAGVLDLLLADPAPARHFGPVILVGRPGMDDAARPEGLAELRILGIVVHLRLVLRVQVVKVAEEFVEAVIRRQHVIQVAEVVLAELAGGVALLRNAAIVTILSGMPTGAAGIPTLERPVR